MAHSNHQHHHILLAVAVAAFLATGEAAASGTVGFDLHHRFSPAVRRWAGARGLEPHPLAARDGSPEYYSALSRHDRALLARRGLAGGDPNDGLLALAGGNDTFRINNLGFLYYAEVSVGTPNATFLVALDTGSDLLWVPCDCKSCAPIAANATGPAGPTLQPYSPRLSSTSKPVTCANALCDRPNACGSGNGSCPYAVRYVSANTSSSGVLVEDVVHLAREGSGPGGAAAVQAPIVFGCGQVQTGLFLEGAAADGLLGLGMARVSVPSVLAAGGLVGTDSFSMCFSPGGAGRLSFGDAGGRGQAETPFIVASGSSHPTYNVSFTAINVESKSAAVEFTAVIDSGTSFTYLNDPEYTELATNFNSQVRERRTNFSTGSAAVSVPFEYCYGLSPTQTELFLPEVSLTTKGGALFPVTRPIIIFVDEINGETRPVGYCLAIVKSDISVNIIGQNFMTGLKVVFDRQRSVLGWQKFDCYKNEGVADAPGGSPGAAPSPTRITPQQNDRYPGAVPVPRSAAGELGGRCHSLLLQLLPLLAAAFVV